MIKVAPSILAADFANLERDIHRIEQAGAHYVHVDIMDGIFVPNISIGIPVVAAVKRVSSLPLDVHLMIDRPIRYVPQFLKAGADILTLHIESDTTENTLAALELIQDAGRIPAVTIKPGSPVEAVLPFLPCCGLVLVMTVEPGFGGQSFMADMMPKVRYLHDYIKANKLRCELEVDGGVSLETAGICTENGADVLVAGSAFFKAADQRAFVESVAVDHCRTR